MRTFTLIAILALAAITRAEGPATQPTMLSNAAGELAVDSSTGDRGGHVFAAMIGTIITVKDGRISWVEKWGTDAKGRTNWMRVSRKLVPQPAISNRAVDLVADGPYKAWSRVGIVEVEGDELRLCVNFPQGPRLAVA